MRYYLGNFVTSVDIKNKNVTVNDFIFRQQIKNGRDKITQIAKKEYRRARKTRRIRRLRIIETDSDSD